jgi:hypothetical protein
MGFYEQNLRMFQTRTWKLYEATEFGTIFTTIVLNLTSCQWHVDLKDKFAVLLYFGNFTGGSFLLAPPVGLNLPV